MLWLFYGFRCLQLCVTARWTIVSTNHKKQWRKVQETVKWCIGSHRNSRSLTTGKCFLIKMLYDKYPCLPADGTTDAKCVYHLVAAFLKRWLSKIQTDLSSSFILGIVIFVFIGNHRERAISFIFGWEGVWWN